jgi:SEC-C motif-containing protein
MKQTVCCCDSGKAFKQCCSPLLERTAVSKTAKKLMRSRYTAYVLGGYGDYLLATWHPDHRVGLDAATLSMKTTDWQSLEILDSSQDHDVAFVEFAASFLESDRQTGVLHERSRFQRIAGHWYYVDGTVGTVGRKN